MSPRIVLTVPMVFLGVGIPTPISSTMERNLNWVQFKAKTNRILFVVD